MPESIKDALARLLSARSVVNSGLTSTISSWRHLAEVHKASKTEEENPSDDELDAALATLKEFKALRNRLRPILGAAETAVEGLQEMCLPRIRMCGMNSLPDELIRRIFEVRYGPHHIPPPYFDMPMELSHVCRRFRSIALHTPRIWTKLCNWQPYRQLEMYMERSKAADLSIYIFSSSSEGFHSDLIPEFLALVTKHSKRWSFIHYSAPHRYNLPGDDEPPDLPYTHPALLDYPNLDLPRLTHLSWLNADYERSKDISPVIPYECWNKPNLVHFEGFNVMADIPSLGSNLRSCGLKFHSEDDGAWDLDDFLHTMESSTMLKSLTLQISHANSSGSTDHIPSKISLTSLHTFDLCLNFTMNADAVLQLLSSLVMPTLTQITVTFGFENDRKDAVRMFNAIVSCVAQSPLLEKFTFRYTARGYPSMANRGILHTLAQDLPRLREVSVAGPGFSSSIFDSRIRINLAWRLLTVADCSETDYRVILQLAHDIKEDGRLGGLKIRVTKSPTLDILQRHLEDNIITW
ncbi:hypothetical protein BD410DRAFT_794306 [Rickenella mellea]|uniref:F-box domain-containing protein n=1 Tax=Rickenella mellea TaxID=50990 RepID=A0A4Y7PRJ2_9AGAM|nr:hypothetical protein BD410DRAFT_794306 [Rickenella mellea]